MIRESKKRQRMNLDIDHEILTEKELFDIKIKYDIYLVHEKGLEEFLDKVASFVQILNNPKNDYFSKV